jgi:hypothetical protein
VKITPIAAASIIPATLIGVALSIIVPLTTPAAATASSAEARAVHTASRPPATAQHTRTTAHPVSAAHAAAAAPAPQPAATQAPTPAPPPAPQMSAAEASFENCVAWRESGDNPTASSAGLFGILPAIWSQLGYPGTAGQSSVALQKVAFDRLYQELGTQPWAPYDGC